MFLIGKNHSNEKEVDEESNKYDDIIQFSHKESYDRIEYKLLAFYEYVNQKVDGGIHLGRWEQLKV